MMIIHFDASWNELSVFVYSSPQQNISTHMEKQFCLTFKKFCVYEQHFFS